MLTLPKRSFDTEAVVALSEVSRRTGRLVSDLGSTANFLYSALKIESLGRQVVMDSLEYFAAGLERVRLAHI
jgi:hypothetical protein